MPPTLISILRNITLKEKAGKKKRKEKKRRLKEIMKQEKLEWE